MPISHVNCVTFIVRKDVLYEYYQKCVRAYLVRKKIGSLKTVKKQILRSYKKYIKNPLKWKPEFCLMPEINITRGIFFFIITSVVIFSYVFYFHR